MSSIAVAPPKPGQVLTGKTSVVAQLTLFVAAVMGVLLGGVLTVSYVEGRRVLRQQIDDRLSAVAESHREIVRAYVSQLEERVAMNATGGASRGLLGELADGKPGDLNRKYAGQTFARICAGGWAVSARLLDAAGRVVVSTDPDEAGRSLSGEAVFVEGLNGVHIGLPQAVGERFEARISAPVRKLPAPEDVAGVLVLTVDVTPLARAVQDRTGLGTTGEVLLGVREDETIRFIFPTPDGATTLPRADAPAMMAAIEGRKELARTRDYRGQPVLTIGRPIGYGGWGLVAKIDEREAYAPIAGMQRLVLAVAGLAGLAGLAGCYGLARGFTRPIRRLAHAAEAIARGEVAKPLAIGSRNEIGALAATFDAMAAALLARTAEREKAEAQLAADRALLRTLIDVLPLSLYVKDAESRFLVANDEAARSIGAASAQEVLGRTDADYFPAPLAEAFRENELRVLGGEPLLNLEHESKYPDGSARTELSTKVPLRDGEGRIIGIVGVSRDITAQKRAEEAARASEARYRLLADHTDDFLSLETLDGRHLYVSPSYYRMTGWTPEDLATADWRTRMHPDDLPAIAAAKARMNSEDVVAFEHRIRCSDGRWIWVEQHCKLITDEAGEPRRLFWCHQITARKHAEEALAAERTLLRTVIDTLPVSIYVKDRESRFTVANAECARAVGGRSSAELIGKTDADFFPPSIAAAFRADEVRVLEGESILNLEEASAYPDGSERTELTTKVPLRDASGAIVGIVGVSGDITERKRADEALRESEALLRSITDHTADSIFVKDRESRTIFKNPAGLRVNALPAEKVLGRSDSEFAPDPVQAAQFLATDRRVMETRETVTVEEVLTSATGEKHVLLTTKTPRFDAAGNVIGLVGVARDITAQKVAEAALRESEARLRTLGDNIPGGAIYQLLAPPEGAPRYVYISAGIERLFGMPTELVLAEPEAFWRLIVEEDRARIAETQARATREMKLFDCEFRQRSVTGEVKWVHARSTPRRLADGSILWDGVVTDITAQKAVEEKLRESNARYELIVTGTAAGIWDWDVLAKRVYYSPRWVEMRGFTPSEISDREEEWNSRIHPDDHERVIASLRAHIAGETPVFAEEYRIRCKDGSWKWVLDRGVARRDETGRAVRMAGSEIDVTERKQAEEALRESEASNRAILESALDCVVAMDHAGRIVEFNPAAERTFGYTRAEALGQSLAELLIPPAMREQHRRGLARYLATGRGAMLGQRLELTAMRRDGAEFPVELAINRIAGAEPPVFTGFIRDITQRKRAEEEIRASLHEKEVLLREVHHRVKNNLQIVSSLLNLQCRQLADPEQVKIFASTRDRVRAMAAVHERLYESGDFARIDLAAHLSALVRALTRAHAPAGFRLQPALRLEPMTVNLNTAVPLSLIANELIINALKYAFVGRTEGALQVELRVQDGFGELRVIDDGPGLSASVDSAAPRTLGLRLVRDLARQIRGELEIDSTASGANIAIRWPARPTTGESTAPADDAGSPII